MDDLNTVEDKENRSPETKQQGRARRLAANFSLALSGFLVACLLVELVFRLLGIGRPIEPTGQIDPRGFAPDPELIFTLRPGFNGRMWNAPAHYNRLGMRDGEIPPEKPRGEFRILMLGDSVTYGIGVALEKTFSKILERRLNKSASRLRFRVFNAGCPAYNTMQEYRFLLRLLDRVKPDLVVLNFTPTNDYETPYRLDQNGYIRPTAVRPEDFSIHLPLENTLGRVSFAYRFAAEKIRARLMAPRSRALLARIFKEYRENGQGWRRCKKYLLKMNELLKGRGIRLALFIYPEPTEKPAYRREDYPFAEIYKKVEDFCRANGIAYLDILDDFLAYRDKKRLFVTPTDAHPSPLAHELAAKALERELRRRRLLPEGK